VHPLSIATLQERSRAKLRVRSSFRRPNSAAQCHPMLRHIPRRLLEVSPLPTGGCCTAKLSSPSAIRCTAGTMAPFTSPEAMLHCQSEAGRLGGTCCGAE
jgi:hypothetical protein